MKRVLLTLLFAVILTGCTSKSIPETDTEPVVQNSNETDYFEKKQECAKYMETAKRKAESITEHTEYNDTLNAGKESEFQKIFYSPQADSCMYILYTKAYINGIYKSITYSLYDALTGEEVYWTYGCIEISDDCDKTQLEGSNEFREILKEYE